MNANHDKALGFAILLLLIGISAYIGIESKNVFVGIGCFVGIMFVFTGSIKAIEVKYKFFGWYALIVIGVLILETSARYSMFEGRWLWSIIWTLCALALIRTGTHLRRDEKIFFRYVGNIAIFWSIFLGIYGVLGPLMLYNIPAQMFRHPSAEIYAMSFGAIKFFLLSVLKSFWGIAYILILLFLGYLLARLWGIILTSLMLTGVVMDIGVRSSKLLGWSVMVFTSNPMEAIKEFLVYSAHKAGSAGIGALILGFVVPLFLLPAFLKNLEIHERLKHFPEIKKLFGTTFAYQYLRSGGIKLSFSGFLGSLMIVVTLLILPILLWIVLRKLPGLEEIISLSFLGIPDITVPHFKPVWHVSYFILALILAVSFAFSRRPSFHLQEYPEKVLVLSKIIGSSIVFSVFSMFVPAGVTLFLLSYTIGHLLFLRYLFPTVVSSFVGKPSQPAKEEYIFQQPQPSPQVEKEKPKVYKPQEKSFVGDLVFEHQSPIVDIVPADLNTFYVLDAKGVLSIYKSIYEDDSKTLSTSTRISKLNEPVGLVKLESELLLLDRQGKVFITPIDDQGFESKGGFVESINTKGLLTCFTVNPYGSILAFSSTDPKRLMGLFVASRKVVPLYMLENLPEITALNFSHDNRFLAIGTSSGDTLILDMASRNITRELSSGTFPIITPVRDVSRIYQQGVSHIRSVLTPENKIVWIVVYGSNTISNWLMVHGIWTLHKMEFFASNFGCALTAIDIDRENERIVVGSEDGYIYMFSSRDLKLLWKGKVSEVEVVKVIYLKNNILISVCSNNSVYIVKLPAKTKEL